MIFTFNELHCMKTEAMTKAMPYDYQANWFAARIQELLAMIDLKLGSWWFIQRRRSNLTIDQQTNILKNLGFIK